MAFMKKEVLLAEAERLGLTEDLEGKTWAEQQKLVQSALAVENPAKLVKHATKRYGLGQRMDERFETFDMAVEIKPQKVQLIKYDEVVGEEQEVEEFSYGLDDFKSGVANKDMNMKTYTLKGKTGRKVVAQSTAPKENFGMTYNPQTDVVPVVHADGKEGYLFSHHSLKGIKQLIMEAGEDYWWKYKGEFSAAKGTLWYAYAKVLVCDRRAAEYVLRQIERDAQAKRNEQW